MAKHFGIDFGTTNSAVVLYDTARTLDPFKQVGDGDGSVPVPSVVAVDNLTHKVTVGRSVKDKIIKLREGGGHLVVESVKSLLDSDEVWKTPSGVWRPEDVAAELFSALSAKAKIDTGSPIREAVVAIPVGMTATRRAALRRAAKAAGIDVLTFISEPTAAFIAHAGDLRHCRYSVVFDWGGGTLDVSVLESRDGCVVERFTAGSARAGDYIDELLARWLHTRIADRHGLTLPFEGVDPNERHVLLAEAERVKRVLQQEGATAEAVRLGRYAGLELVEERVAVSDFNEIIEPVVTDALDLLMGSVAEARVSQKEIGRLIVVGGSSKLSLLREELRSRWPEPNIDFPEGADWAIAQGAAWLAANPGQHRMSEGVGVILADDSYHSIFPPGTAADRAAAELHFGLVEDAATATFNFATLNGVPSGHRPSHIGEMHVESFGFSDELIKLACRITPDLVFEAVGGSDFKAKRAAHFAYDRLRWMYEAPDGR